MLRLFVIAPVALSLAAGAACRKKTDTAPPVATPSFSMNHPRAPLGSPIEVTYRFVVAPSATFDQNYRVLVHFLDADEELMWTDDHNPATPTTQWKPGQTIEYQRTLFVPIYPYLGEATVEMGLYSTTTQKRLPLAGQDSGQRSYRVGKIQLLPQTENVFLIFKDGWHPAEVSENNAAVEWQWTKKEATIAFRNPKKNSVFYLDVDCPGGAFTEPQMLEVRLGDQTLDRFPVDVVQRSIRKILISAAQLGTVDMIELKLTADKTFVPALLPASTNRDPRELGVRVFHAFVEPQ